MMGKRDSAKSRKTAWILMVGAVCAFVLLAGRICCWGVTSDSVCAIL
ncbi:MAG: hypothetical protein NC305_10420 [Lachnospiraceae bacterium]|nr:hypothetical protein [Lachnospiraceae bacterium]MCM1410946.1 hypothetical protein [Lachnospiraceae bacterium]